MLCERILGNVKTDRSDGNPPRAEDQLPIHWWELERRAFRKVTRSGRTVRLLLPLGHFLTDGDVLCDDGATRIVVRVLPSDVWVVRPRDAAEMGLVALEIGNLHAPAEVLENEILVAPDGPVESMLRDLGVAFEPQVRVFRPRRCAGMPALRIAPEFEVRT